jgi:hypothetical protein
MHIADGIDMDEQSHSGDHQDHYRRKGILQEPHRRLEIARSHPLIDHHLQRSALRGQAEEREEGY